GVAAIEAADALLVSLVQREHAVGGNVRVDTRLRPANVAGRATARRPNAVARIVDTGREGLRQTRVKLADIRSTNGPRVSTTEANVINGLPRRGSRIAIYGTDR